MMGLVVEARDVAGPGACDAKADPETPRVPTRARRQQSRPWKYLTASHNAWNNDGGTQSFRAER